MKPLDAKVKHRLVGIAVIFSFLGVFLPFLLQKNNVILDDTVQISQPLPDKPEVEDVVPPKESEIFVEEKVAHVTLPNMPNMPDMPDMAESSEVLAPSDNQNVVPTAQASKENKILDAASKPEPKKIVEALNAKRTPAPVLKASLPSVQEAIKNQASLSPQNTARQAISKKIIAQAAIPYQPVKALVTERKTTYSEHYAVQVAHFSDKKNALALLSKLHTSGFNLVTIRPVKLGKNETYRVFVGNEADRIHAIHLQNQLASKLHMNGFLVINGAG